MQTILIIGIIQSIIFLLLNVQKSNKTVADTILLLWLFVFGIHLVLLLLFENHLHTRFSIVIAKTILLLHGPILFIYAHTILKVKHSLKLTYHFAPFLLLSLAGLFITKDYVMPWENVLVVLKLVSILSYPIYTIFWLTRRNNNLKSENSNNIILEIRWIKTLAYLLSFSFAISVSYLLINQTFNFDLSNNLDTIVYVIMIMVMGYYGLKLGIVFKPNVVEENPSFKTKKSYQHSPLDTSRIQKIKRLIQSFFNDREEYLRPNFSLTQLSQQLDIPKHHLSQVINTEMGMTFYDLVNNKRVEYAMNEIKSKPNLNITLETLGYDAGFNTKAAFYFHFKKITGKTPGQYKKQISID